MKPKGIPLTIAFIQLTAASTRTLNSRGIEYPSYRFRPYGTLEEDIIPFVLSLGYDERSWNSLGVNPWEVYSYKSIQSDASSLIIDSIQRIGFTEDVWDCYINHYRDFTWQELADEGVIVFAAILGWNEEMWDGFTSSPETELMLWDDLTIGQQQAAAEFCFTKEIWNKVSLDDWEVVSSGTENSLVATASPSGTSTGLEDTIISPSITPIDFENSASPSIAPSEATVTITNSSDVNESSSIPAAQQSMLPTVSPSTDTQQSISDDPSFSSIPPVDDIRYVVWDNLQEYEKGLALELGYDQDTWNTPGTANIEYYSIRLLYEAELEDAHGKISELGFSDEQWDCYVHHYISFSWKTLEEIGVDIHFISLGWSKSSWEGEINEVPASEEKSWDELTEEERAGARGICYIFQTWDGYSLDDEAWKTTTETTQNPTSDQGDLPPVDAGITANASSSRNAHVTLSTSILTVISIASLFVE